MLLHLTCIHHRLIWTCEKCSVSRLLATLILTEFEIFCRLVKNIWASCTMLIWYRKSGYFFNLFNWLIISFIALHGEWAVTSSCGCGSCATYRKRLSATAIVVRISSVQLLLKTHSCHAAPYIVNFTEICCILRCLKWLLINLSLMYLDSIKVWKWVYLFVMSTDSHKFSH